MAEILNGDHPEMAGVPVRTPAIRPDVPLNQWKPLPFVS